MSAGSDSGDLGAQGASMTRSAVTPAAAHRSGQLQIIEYHLHYECAVPRAAYTAALNVVQENRASNVRVTVIICFQWVALLSPHGMQFHCHGSR